MASPTTKADNLTTREREVLTLIAAGESTKELAFTLGIAFKTAACHRTHVLEKLGARNTAEAIRNAAALGLLELAANQLAPPDKKVEGQDTQSPTILPWQGLEDMRSAGQRLFVSLNRTRSLHAKLAEICYDLRCALDESKVQRLVASLERRRNAGQV